MLTDTDDGKAAFHLIEKFHNEDDGYIGGHFYNEWQALTCRYEEVEEKPLSELRKEYYNERMLEHENPSLWLVQMERQKAKLCKMGYKIEDEAFLMDVLEALPLNNDKSTMNPYQIKKQFLLQGIEKEQWELAKITKELSQVYADNYRDKKTSSKEDGGEKGFFVSNKTVCHECGQMGHKKINCKNKNRTHNGNSNKYNHSGSRGRHSGGRSNYPGNRNGRGGGRGRGYSRYPPRQQEQEGPMFQGTCDHCGRKGHKKEK